MILSMLVSATATSPACVNFGSSANPNHCDHTNVYGNVTKIHQCKNDAICTDSTTESAVSYHAYQCTCVSGFANGMCEYTKNPNETTGFSVDSSSAVVINSSSTAVCTDADAPDDDTAVCTDDDAPDDDNWDSDSGDDHFSYIPYDSGDLYHRMWSAGCIGGSITVTVYGVKSTIGKWFFMMYREYDAPRKAILERRAQYQEDLEKCTQASRDARVERLADFDQKMKMISFCGAKWNSHNLLHAHLSVQFC